MLNFTQGYVKNTETNATANIVVKALSSKSVKDLVIGGVTTILGIGYLVYSSFRNGANAMEQAEYDALCDAGIINETVDSNEDEIKNNSYEWNVNTKE